MYLKSINILIKIINNYVYFIKIILTKKIHKILIHIYYFNSFKIRLYFLFIY